VATGFAATVYGIVPLPEPAPVPPIVIHGALVVALHAQPVNVVKVTVPAPPPSVNDCVAGLAVYVQVPPAWVIVNGSPPIVSVAVRGLVVPLAATEYPTVPLPLPLAPLVIVTHGADEAAVHAQPPSAATATVPVVVVAGTDAPAGVNV
jgi:hypothetical protein